MGLLGIFDSRNNNIKPTPPKMGSAFSQREFNRNFRDAYHGLGLQNVGLSAKQKETVKCVLGEYLQGKSITGTLTRKDRVEFVRRLKEVEGAGFTKTDTRSAAQLFDVLRNGGPSVRSSVASLLLDSSIRVKNTKKGKSVKVDITASDLPTQLKRPVKESCSGPAPESNALSLKSDQRFAGAAGHGGGKSTKATSPTPPPQVIEPPISVISDRKGSSTGQFGAAAGQSVGTERLDEQEADDLPIG